MRRLFVIGFTLLVACEDGDSNQTPDTQIDSQPAALTNLARSTFAFRSLGNSNAFFCRIDQADPTVCIPPLVVDLPDGEHTFEVAAALNTNIDETPATFAWRIDTVAPSTAI